MKEIEDDCAFRSWKMRFNANASLLFCTSNIQDQISFIRASIMRKSYREVSVKLGIRIEGGGVVYRSILSLPFEKEKEYFYNILFIRINIFVERYSKFLSTWKERMIK